jgi:hypothetical protein
MDISNEYCVRTRLTYPFSYFKFIFFIIIEAMKARIIAAPH